MLCTRWAQGTTFQVGGQDPPGEGPIWGCSAPLEVHCNSESAENGNILAVQYTYIPCYTIYISTDSIWPQQYMGVVHLQVHVCIYAKKSSL